MRAEPCLLCATEDLVLLLQHRFAIDVWYTPPHTYRPKSRQILKAKREKVGGQKGTGPSFLSLPFRTHSEGRRELCSSLPPCWVGQQLRGGSCGGPWQGPWWSEQSAALCGGRGAGVL